MNSVDAILLAMLAVIDLAFLVHLRRRRNEAARKDRVMRSLVVAIRQENGDIPVPQKRRLAKAS